MNQGAKTSGREKGRKRRSPIVRPELDGAFPEHIAIIMDGNGRWAQERGKRRIFGHRSGIDSVREATTNCARMGVKSLTLYAFSVENWKRPRPEVRYLMRLLRHFLVGDFPPKIVVRWANACAIAATSTAPPPVAHDVAGGSTSWPCASPWS